MEASNSSVNGFSPRTLVRRPSIENRIIMTRAVAHEKISSLSVAIVSSFFSA